MRRRLQKAAVLAAVTGLFRTAVYAQGTWVAPEVPGVDLATEEFGTNDYYLYNVKADAFVTRGASWNMQALATRLTDNDEKADGPHKVKVTKTEAGNFQFSVFDKSFLGGPRDGVNNVYADHGTAENNEFKATAIEGTKTFTLRPLCANDEAQYPYLDVAGKRGWFLTYADGQGYTQWALLDGQTITSGAYRVYKAKQEMYDVYAALSEEDHTTYKTALEAANVVYLKTDASLTEVHEATAAMLKAVAPALTNTSVDASALFTNADMLGAGRDGWTITGELVGPSWGDFECYHKTLTMTQTQTGLPNGLYTVAFHGFYRQDKEGEPAPKYTLTSGENTHSEDVVRMNTLGFGVVSGNGNSGNWTWDGNTKPNGMQSAGQALSCDLTETRVNEFFVNNGELTITISMESTEQWFNFKGVDIYYRAESADNLKTSLQEAVTALENLINSSSLMNTVLKTETAPAVIADAKTKLEGNDSEAIKASLVNVQSVKDRVTRSLEAYENMREAFSYTDPRIGSVTDESAAKIYTDFKAKYEAGKLESTEEGYPRLPYDKLAEAARSQEYVVGRDYTEAILNHGFERGSLMGWTISKNSDDTGVKRTDNNTYKMEGSKGTYLFNTWKAGVKLSQKIEGLPQGAYYLSAAVASDAGKWLRIDANGKTSPEIRLNNNADKSQRAGMLVTVGEDGILDFGVRGNTEADWYKVDDFRLIAAEENIGTAVEALHIYVNEVKAKNIDVTVNAGNGVFQRNAEKYQTALNAAYAALADLTPAEATVLQAKKDLEAGMELNTPEADTRYNVICATTDNFENKGKAVTFELGGQSEEQGLYAAKFISTPNVNYAQAIEFVKAEGGVNLYTLKFTDNDGNDRYICDGTVTDAGTGAAGIRTTSDASKALKVEVIATNTEGVYNLRNTVANALLGSQDAGWFTTESHVEHSLKLAPKAEVTVTVLEAGWATLILPFHAEIPEGLKVYTWNGSTQASGTSTVVALEKVETGIKANTPYIVTGAGEYKFSDYGLAIKNEYADDYMTGVYTQRNATAGTYVLQNQESGMGFYKVVEGSEPTVGAYRAFLTSSGSSSAGVNVLALLLPEDGVTDIYAVTSSEVEVNVYSLNGVLVRENVKLSEALNGLKKGIYIVNGTKRAVK